MATLYLNGLPSLSAPAELKKDSIVSIDAVDDSASSSSSGENAVAEDDWVYPMRTDFKLSERPVDEIRELKVAAIGAGISGITIGAVLPVKVPGIKLTIFEKNADVGGTWFENTYPGVRCDIPAHVYQSSFCPNTQWTEEYAQGREIWEYWRSVARKYDIYSRLRARTKVVGAYWQAEKSNWRLDITDLESGRQSSEEFDFVITGIGHFNDFRVPDFPGIEKYKGHLRHSSNWDDSFDPTGKRVATIGNGASGIQVTPAMQKVAAHVDHYARTPTWIGGSFSYRSEERRDEPMYFSREQLESFKDPHTYQRYRRHLEEPFWRNFDGQIAGSETSKNATKKFTNLMEKRLGGDQELLKKLTPNFPPNCRRLTPGPGYLEALQKPNLTLIQTPISHLTETGVVTTDGVHREVDAIICSTGANTDFTPPFPIVSGELDLSRDWKPSGKYGFPYAYLGMATPHFPNLAFVLGPNPFGAAGTTNHSIEVQVTYVAKMLRKMATQRIRTMAPSAAATDDFVAYCDAFFPRTNLAMKCSSWSNGGRPGARIHGHWPGSAAHVTYVRREPRWEDFEYTYERPENRFAYLGNGWTRKELAEGSDMTPHIRIETQNDLRELHERWWEV